MPFLCTNSNKVKTTTYMNTAVDYYSGSNGYEIVEKGCSRRLSLKLPFSGKTKNKRQQQLVKQSKKGQQHTVQSGNHYSPISDVEYNNVELQCAPPVPHSLHQKCHSKKNNGYGGMPFPSRCFKKRTSIAPGELGDIHENSSVVAPAVKNNNSVTENNSEHIYSDALYNEISEVQSCDMLTAAATENGANFNVHPRNGQACSHAQGCSAVALYDTPNFDKKKFSTTNSKDEFSQLAMYRLEGPFAATSFAFVDDDTLYWGDSGDGTTVNINNRNRNNINNNYSSKYNTTSEVVVDEINCVERDASNCCTNHGDNVDASSSLYETCDDRRLYTRPYEAAASTVVVGKQEVCDENEGAAHIYSVIDAETKALHSLEREKSSSSFNTSKSSQKEGLSKDVGIMSLSLAERPSSTSSDTCSSHSIPVFSKQSSSRSAKGDPVTQCDYGQSSCTTDGQFYETVGEPQLCYNLKIPFPQTKMNIDCNNESSQTDAVSLVQGSSSSYNLSTVLSQNECPNVAAQNQQSVERPREPREELQLSAESSASDSQYGAIESVEQPAGGVRTESVDHQEANSEHYEYAEPGEGAAWYYHNRIAENLNEEGDSNNAGNESDSIYNESAGAVRYHVITMRPRLGSDGGRSLARQQDYQGRFGPYSCVHLYINEEAIRAQEDNHACSNAVISFSPTAPRQSVIEHIYDMPPFETQHSMPHLQSSGVSSVNLINRVPFSNVCSAINHKSCQFGCSKCLSSSCMVANGQASLGQLFSHPPVRCNSSKCHESNSAAVPISCRLNENLYTNPDKISKHGAAASSFIKFFSHLKKPFDKRIRVPNEDQHLNTSNHLFSSENEQDVNSFGKRSQKSKPPTHLNVLTCSALCNPCSHESRHSVSPNSPLPAPPTTPLQSTLQNSCNAGSRILPHSWLSHASAYTDPSTGARNLMANTSATTMNPQNSCDFNNNNSTSNITLLIPPGAVAPLSASHGLMSSAETRGSADGDKGNRRKCFISNKMSNMVAAEVGDSDHYYSEVQYYQNAYEEDSNATIEVEGVAREESRVRALNMPKTVPYNTNNNINTCNGHVNNEELTDQASPYVCYKCSHHHQHLHVSQFAMPPQPNIDPFGGCSSSSLYAGCHRRIYSEPINSVCDAAAGCGANYCGDNSRASIGVVMAEAQSPYAAGSASNNNSNNNLVTNIVGGVADDNDDAASVSSCEATYDHLFEPKTTVVRSSNAQTMSQMLNNELSTNRTSINNSNLQSSPFQYLGTSLHSSTDLSNKTTVPMRTSSNRANVYESNPVPANNEAAVFGSSSSTSSTRRGNDCETTSSSVAATAALNHIYQEITENVSGSHRQKFEESSGSWNKEGLYSEKEIVSVEVQDRHHSSVCSSQLEHSSSNETQYLCNSGKLLNRNNDYIIKRKFLPLKQSTSKLVHPNPPQPTHEFSLSFDNDTLGRESTSNSSRSFAAYGHNQLPEISIKFQSTSGLEEPAVKQPELDVLSKSKLLVSTATTPDHNHSPVVSSPCGDNGTKKTSMHTKSTTRTTCVQESERDYDLL